MILKQHILFLYLLTLLEMLWMCLLVFARVTSLRIPYIDNTIFIPVINSTTRVVVNQTCDQCICMFQSSHLALNCFPNNTCQLFNTFPLTYTIQIYPQARLYFLQDIFPNTNHCCLPETSYLINKLISTNRISVPINSPRCLIWDGNGYLVTVSQNSKRIIRLNPSDLTNITFPPSPIFPDSPMSIIYYNQTYFIAFPKFILLVNSTDLSVMRNISSPFFSELRDILILDGGKVMMVVCTASNTLIFFNRSNNYSFIARQYTNQTNPHGLKRINDSFFYLTSWNDNTVYAYSPINSTYWKGEPFINAASIAPNKDGNHVTIDQCNRYWFSLGANGLFFYNYQGILLGNTSNLTKSVFDTMITDNYTIYIADSASNRVIRLDPEIHC